MQVDERKTQDLREKEQKLLQKAAGGFVKSRIPLVSWYQIFRSEPPLLSVSIRLLVSLCFNKSHPTPLSIASRFLVAFLPEAIFVSWSLTCLLSCAESMPVVLQVIAALKR